MKSFARRGWLFVSAVAVSVPLLTLTGQEEPAANGSRQVTSDFGLEGVSQGVDASRLDPPGPLSTVRNMGGYSRVTEEPGRDLPYQPGRVIVKFRDGTDSAARLSTMASADVESAERPAYADFEILRIDTDRNPEQVAAELSARPEVLYAQADYRLKASLTPNDPLFSEQWNLTALDMQRAWDINPGATRDIIVAVIDSGVAWRTQTITYTTVPVRMSNGQIGQLQLSIPFAAAPELFASDRFVAPRDFNWRDNNPSDLSGHGTHVSGTIGQLTNNGLGVAGMAFNVRIMPVKIIPSELESELFAPPVGATDATLAEALRYAADNGAKVINMSLGRAGGPASPAVEAALRYAVDRGAFCAIAAGNEFEEGNPISSPARHAPDIEGVVAVAAVGRNLRRSYFSNTGTYVELTAPGGDMRSGGSAGGVLQQTYLPDAAEAFPPRFDLFVYRPLQGTSMATPHVSGFAALLMQQGITSPAAVEAAMKRFAQDLGTPGRDNEYGVGLIRPRETLRGLGLAR